ncbi:MAG TPA: hypothetical protein VM095_14195 [Pyrinomonadaceae bacterium]|nr:hypothetical protein [Pyrinomonadaceae bacterium]
MTEQNMGDATEKQSNQAVDDRGTDQTEGRAILKRLRDNGFESSDEKLAVALGRPLEEVQAWTTDGGGGDPVDDDVIMKARGIAKERGIEIE